VKIMMSRFWRALGLLGSGIAFLVLLMVLLLSLGLGYGTLLLLLVLAAAYAWMLFAYWHYRELRREEFLQVLAAAAEAEAPLAPALWAYLSDRPHVGWRRFWTSLVLFFVVPGYYWLWYSGSSFDRKVERVADLLDEGYSLPEALRRTPGVASRETRLAAALGQDTGQLARCLRALRSPARSRLAGLWLEMVPRFAYPLFLLLIINGVLVFWILYIAPRYERIFKELHMALPEETERALALGHLALHYAWVLTLAIPVLAGLLLLLLVSPTIRWYFPVVGRFYRGYVSGRTLQALAFLLQVGQPAPEALGVLAESGAFVGRARRRLEAIRRRVEQGESLPDSLRWGKVLPRPMVPLLRTAERVGNLPWALAELADVMGQRAVRRLQRLGMVLFPVPIIGVGVLVGVIALGLFMPLVTIINGLVVP
jgi:type II secretory pathway component PulF